MKVEIGSFEDAVHLARCTWQTAKNSKSTVTDTWISIGDHYDLNLFAEITDDLDGKIQAHLYRVFDGRTNTRTWFVLCEDSESDHWVDDLPTLYTVTHTYGNGVTAYQFRSYKTYGGWYGPDGDAPPKEVLEALGIDFDPDCEETLDIAPVDNEEEIKLI